MKKNLQLPIPRTARSSFFAPALLFGIRMFGCSNARLFCIWLLIANCLLLRTKLTRLRYIGAVPILFLLFVIGPTAPLCESPPFWRTNSFSQCGWTQKANFGGTAREYAVGFSIGTKGYIGTGSSDGTSYKDFWEWNQNTNV